MAGDITTCTVYDTSRKAVEEMKKADLRVVRKGLKDSPPWVPEKKAPPPPK